MEAVVCTKCHAPIPAKDFNTLDLIPCPFCHVPIKIDVFPAFLRGLRPGKAGEGLMDDQASCFYHPQKKAVVPCDHCGRFLCALCDVEWSGKHLCPACLETGKRRGRITNLARHRVLYDGIALRVALFPMLFIWLTAITAPVALYFAIRHWNSPMGLVRRSKIRFILAMAISGLQMLAWATWIVYTFLRR